MSAETEKALDELARCSAPSKLSKPEYMVPDWMREIIAKGVPAPPTPSTKFKSPLASPTSDLQRNREYYMPAVANQWFVTNGVNPLHLLAIRVRVTDWNTRSDGKIVPHFPNIDHLDIYLDENKAFVQYVKGGKLGNLEDDAKHFPSDELLAAMRLLMK